MSSTIPDGDWSDYNVDDIALKIWIPQVLDECLEGLTDRFGQTKSDLARNALMIHVHGRYIFERLVEHKMWRSRRRQQVEEQVKYVTFDSDSGRKFNAQTIHKLRDSPRTSFIRAFGKNTQDLKVWMPLKLERLIATLSTDAALTTSEYTRRALTAYYLGRTVIDPMMPRENGED